MQAKGADTMDTRERIKAIVATTLGPSGEDLVAWDVAHQFEIVSSVEEAFGVRFDAQEVGELNSVEKILRAVEDRTVAGNSRPHALNTETVIDALKAVRPECEFAVDDFFARGVLDSLDLTLLVSALEERLDVTINGLDIVPENFRNVQAIMALMARYGVPA
jgi:acyl carrier protein